MKHRLCVAAAIAAAAFPASATRDAGTAYDLSIAGIPIGEARLSVALDGGRYRVEGTADVGFLFWGGDGTAFAEGVAGEDRLRPERYRLSYRGATRPGAVSIDFEDGRAVRWDREPEPSPEYREGRVEPSGAELAGVTDPLSALVVPAGADAAPEALCARVLPVFSGYTRFDLALDGAKATEAGAVECETRYRPVSGHRADSRSVERLSQPGALSVRLAPVADGLWGPDRVALETRFGLFELQRRR